MRTPKRAEHPAQPTLKRPRWKPVDTLYVCGQCGEQFLALMQRRDGSSFLCLGRYIKRGGQLQPEGNPDAPHVCGDATA